MSQGGDYFDEAMETLSPEARERYYDEKIRWIVEHAYKNAPAIKEKFDRMGVAPSDIRSSKDLEKIPVTKKEELRESQKLNPPFGGFLAVPPEKVQRIYLSPGPLYDPEGFGESRSKEAKTLYGAGFRPGDRVMVTLSYHMVPAGILLDKGLRELGATAIPTGVGQTELQVQLMRDLKITGYVGTATFMMNLIKRAEEVGLDPRKDLFIRNAYLTAEAVPQAIRNTLEKDYGINTWSAYGTADLGMLAYECPRKTGMHICEEAFIEIVDPNTGRRLGPGETGEIVVTSFDETYALIRFGTADLSSIVGEEACPCGRTSARLGPITGRVGDSFKARGMFIHAPQVKQVASKYSELARSQLVITRRENRDILTYKVELSDEAADREKLTTRLFDSFRDIIRLKIDGVEFIPRGTLAEDAKMLVDERKWD